MSPAAPGYSNYSASTVDIASHLPPDYQPASHWATTPCTLHNLLALLVSTASPRLSVPLALLTALSLTRRVLQLPRAGPGCGAGPGHGRVNGATVTDIRRGEVIKMIQRRHAPTLHCSSTLLPAHINQVHSSQVRNLHKTIKSNFYNFKFYSDLITVYCCLAFIISVDRNSIIDKCGRSVGRSVGNTVKTTFP